jgi:phosphohistidine phosphatase
MKTLWVIRHAVAVEREKWDGPDDERPLTPDGAEKMVVHAHALKRLGVKLDRLYTSPWNRAKQTAEILAGLTAKTEITELLARAPGPKLIDALKGDVVGVVGHQPWLSELIGWLVVGDRRDAERRFPLRKGGVVELEGPFAAGGAGLVTIIQPGELRRVARRRK